MPELTLYSPPSARSPRLQRVLDAGLAGLPCRTIASPAELRPGMRLLPAFSLPPDGLCPELFPRRRWRAAWAVSSSTAPASSTRSPWAGIWLSP